ncbi:hypothetical protein XI05_09545 [Bradyrhizobium sp. CCBAU 11357]|nr:hypothetical protein [Bradyrhizobium sp. CCBAU 11357]
MGLQGKPAHRRTGARVAIYSLHHTPVGKSTQAQPYTAAAHIRCISRKDALSAIRQARFPARTPGKWRTTSAGVRTSTARTHGWSIMRWSE